MDTTSTSEGAQSWAGDRDLTGFEALYQAHSGRVYALCLRLAGNPTLAEEWAQEAWMRAWRNLDSFRGDSQFGTWMHRVTVNLALSERSRDRKFRERFELVDDYQSVEGGGGDPSSSFRRSHPSHEVSAQSRMDLERAVTLLPDGAREVFVLYDVEGYKHREIAAQLGVAEGTVKAQLHRARRLLREAMAP